MHRIHRCPCTGPSEGNRLHRCLTSGASKEVQQGSREENTVAQDTPVPFDHARVYTYCHPAESMFSGLRSFLIHRLHRWTVSGAPVHSHSYLSETMQLDFKETLQHRIHRCLLGTCTGASLIDCALIQMSTATIWIQCDRINRCYSFGLSGACDFCVECSQRLGVPLHSI